MRKKIDDSQLSIDKWIGKHSESYIPPENMEHPFNRWMRVVYCPWGGIGLVLAVIADIYGLDSRHCHLCNQIVEFFPSIDTAANIALSDSKVMRIVWLYFTVTTPLICVSSIPALTYWELQESKSIGWFMCGIILTGLLAGAGINSFLKGGHIFIDNPENFLVDTVIGGGGWSFVIFGGFCFALVFLVGQIIVFFKQ